MYGNILQITSVSMGLIVSLMIGLSLVGIQPRYHLTKICLISLVASVFYEVFNKFTTAEISTIIIYLLLVPVIIIFLKIPFLQAAMAIILGMMFDIAFVKLLEYNIFDMVLTNHDLQQDVGIQRVVTLFIFLTNVFIGMLVHQKEPVLFSNELFNMKSSGDKQAVMFKSYLFFSLLILLSMNVFLLYSFVDRGFFTDNFRIFLASWSLFMCGLILFFLRKTWLHKLEQNQLYLDQQYQQEMFSFFNVIRTQRHDFNFHLHSIYGLMNSGKFEESKEYISDVVNNVQKVNVLLPLSHPAISAMLNTLSGVAQQKRITIRYHIFDNLKEMPCSIYDINKLLGNLIQNAIDELEHSRTKSRLIEVEIAKIRDQITISVVNPTTLREEQLEQIFNIGYSTKHKHEGIGLAGIEKIVARYRGIIYPELKDGRLLMHVRIPVID